MKMVDDGMQTIARDEALNLAALDRDQILELIAETVPPGSPEPQDPNLLDRLWAMTEALIEAAGKERLQENPFSEILRRRIKFYEDEVAAIVRGKSILVTGGEGFVGSNLIARLKSTFEVKQVSSVDVADGPSPIDDGGSNSNAPCTYYKVDVRDLAAMRQVFEAERPDIVFHLAAQRLPGLAETQVYRTITTNAIGTENIINLCEEFEVERCVFSSTGKASRYFTPDIYAGSKKIAEWMLADTSKPRKTMFMLVRFTHVVENSPISLEMDEKVARGLVSMHAPDRFTYAQNVEEAMRLVLNSLTMMELNHPRILVTRDIGWCVNTLDIALHKILKSGKRAPLYFKGVPAGYEKHVFMGQLDLGGDREIIPMINVIEGDRIQIVESGDMVIAEVYPYCFDTLHEQLDVLKAAIAEGSDEGMKKALNNAIKTMTLTSFAHADPCQLASIIRWGMNLKQIEIEQVDIRYWGDVLGLLLKGIHNRLDDKQVKMPPGIIAKLRELPEHAAEVEYLAAHAA
jgi:hypothetical protein